MRALLSLASVLVAVSAAAPVRAEPGRFELGARLGGALPYGTLEHGTRFSDTTYGFGTVALDAAYRYAPPVSALAGFEYGVGIPKLCASANDCRSSLGSDVRLELGSRIHVARVGPLRPLVDLGFGYEWYTARLSDGGATSSRGYRGPALLFLRVGGDFRLSRVVRIGPSVGFTLASARAVSLQAPGVSRDAGSAGAGYHGTIELAVRAAFGF